MQLGRLINELIADTTLMARLKSVKEIEKDTVKPGKENVS